MTTTNIEEVKDIKVENTEIPTEKTKEEDTKLLKEFEKMIKGDDKLREFAESKYSSFSPIFNFIENKNQSSDPQLNKEGDRDLESIIDMRILDMLRLLEEYRRK